MRVVSGKDVGWSTLEEELIGLFSIMINPNPVRIFVDVPLFAGAEILLDHGQRSYISNVMRIRSGNRIFLFNGQDGEWSCIVKLIKKRHAIVVSESQVRFQPKTLSSDLWMLCPLIKKNRLNLIIEKSTELGVSRLQPVVTDHTNIVGFNRARARLIAIEAAEQCGRLTVPEINSPSNLESILENWPSARPLFWADPKSNSSRVCGPLSSGALMVGPEGGLNDNDLSILQAHPACSAVYLGPRILRVETAAVAMLVLWQVNCGDWLI